MQATQQRSERASEQRCVARWRYAQLLAAGYERRGAATIAGRRDVDLHLAVGLLERGCSPQTALNILL